MSDDRRLDDAFDPHQRAFDFGRIDLEAATINHVLLAVGDPHVTIGIDGADVAGFPVAAGERIRVRLRIAPIAGDDHRTADPQLPFARGTCAVRQLSPGVVHHDDVAARHDLADALSVEDAIAGRHDRRRRRGLRRAVRVAHLQLRKRFGEAMNRRLRHRRAAVDAEPPFAQVEAREVGLEQAQSIHCRDHQRVRDPLRLCKRQELASLELRHQHQRAADMQKREHHPGQPGDVRPRHAQDRPLASLQSMHIFPVQARMDDVEVRQHRALRLARRA